MKDFLKKNEDKKFIILGGFIILIFVIIIASALIYNKIFYSVSYEEIETTMKNAAIEYTKENKENLPKNINESITIRERQLVDAGKMENINKLIKNEDVSCTGKVIITNINGNYRYNPILNCKDEYKSTKFTDYIKEKIAITETGNGLYNLNNELVYRGDEVNNYLKFSEKMYRIVKLKDDYTVIILTEKTEQQVWDDRYNSEKGSKAGINNYSISRMKDYLDEMYDNNILFSKEDKLSVASYNLPIGKRSAKDTDKSGNLENSIVLENQFIGLLPVYDFLNASLDTNCIETTSAACTNYNYLAKYNFKWWSSTTSSVNSYLVFRFEDVVSLASANTGIYVRPVIYLAKDIMYVSGDGTKENPYIVR